MGLQRCTPPRRFPLTIALALAVTLAGAPGCNTGPARVHPPGIDANRAARLAIQQYDTNGDGLLSAEELEQAPGLKAALPRLDTDGDRAVSADEIAERVRVWQQTRTGLMMFAFTVTLDGRALEGATVTFEPETFLGDNIKPATAQTDSYGGGSATIAREDRPDPSSPPGMHLGLYRVRISKVAGGSETIPPRYNEETILGQEVGYDVPEIANNRVHYALSSR